LVGGNHLTGDIYDKGNFYAPSLVKCEKDSILFSEEVFGPVFPVIKFSKVEDAIEIANDTNYGLGGIVCG